MGISIFHSLKNLLRKGCYRNATVTPPCQKLCGNFSLSFPQFFLRKGALQSQHSLGKVPSEEGTGGCYCNDNGRKLCEDFSLPFPQQLVEKGGVTVSKPPTKTKTKTTNQNHQPKSKGRCKQVDSILSKV